MKKLLFVLRIVVVIMALLVFGNTVVSADPPQPTPEISGQSGEVEKAPDSTPSIEFTSPVEKEAGPLAPSAPNCYTWGVGQRVGLKQGAKIRTGSGLGYSAHTTVPENNWQVDIIGGPRSADNLQWWDVSRRNLDGGGTGWVNIQEAGYDLCGGGGTPPSAASPQLSEGVNLSTAQLRPGEQIRGDFTVCNRGQQAWQVRRLGIGTRGPQYLDFGWAENLTVQGGQCVRFQNTIGAPGALGTYTAYATWQDQSNTWRSLGGDRNFNVVAGTPQGGISINRLWTNDGGTDWSTTKTTFRPGESIRYIGQVNNQTGSTVTARYVWDVRGPSGQIASCSSDLQTAAGVNNMGCKTTVPANASAGTYTFSFSVTYGGQTKSSSTTFTVQGQQPPPTSCTDNATFVGQSAYPIVQLTNSFQIYFEVRNTGTCTWRQSANYYLANINNAALGANARQELGGDVAPGGTKRWAINMTAPSTGSGTYRTQWMVKHGNSTFGPNMYIDVTLECNSGCVTRANGENAKVSATSVTLGCASLLDLDWRVTYNISNSSAWRNLRQEDFGKRRFWATPSFASAQPEAQVLPASEAGRTLVLCLGSKYSYADARASWVWLRP